MGLLAERAEGKSRMIYIHRWDRPFEIEVQRYVGVGKYVAFGVFFNAENI